MLTPLPGAPLTLVVPVTVNEPAISLRLTPPPAALTLCRAMVPLTEDNETAAALVVVILTWLTITPVTPVPARPTTPRLLVLMLTDLTTVPAARVTVPRSNGVAPVHGSETLYGASVMPNNGSIHIRLTLCPSRTWLVF